MNSFPVPLKNTRIGFHYFPDSLHYREIDLQTWVPELQALGASWLVLIAPVDRAIPEHFICGLIANGIEPILHLQASLAQPPEAAELATLFDMYARWGVHYVILFDRPNSRSAWNAATWMQEEPVERFLDRFVPLAETAMRAGLTPVFPPLEPGGSYWDTAFLATAFKSLLRRQQNTLISRMALAAYAWTNNRSLNWGAGGPERWTGARPYFTPPTEEDQRGFRIYEWYQAISLSLLRRRMPLMLLGGALSDSNGSAAADPTAHAQTSLSLARLLANEPVTDPLDSERVLEPVSNEVLCCNMMMLTAANQDYAGQAWFGADGKNLPAVAALRQWTSARENSGAKETVPVTGRDHPIAHYLLLPHYEWGVAEWHLEVIRPFVRRHQPTVGFSLAEAALAARVTVIGNYHTFSEEDLNTLRRTGCLVERISGDGTSIATQLAER